MSISPNYPQDSTIFAAGPDGVYRSTDQGTIWNLINNGMDDTKVLSMSISPDFENDNTIFVGTLEGVYKSVDRGSSWDKVNVGLSGASVLSISVSPNYKNDSTIFAGLMGTRRMRSFGGGEYQTPNGGIYRSTDGGLTWSDLSNRPKISPVAIAISPAFNDDQLLLAGTLDNGILRSSDGGDSWERVAHDLIFERFAAISFSPFYSTDSTAFSAA